MTMGTFELLANGVGGIFNVFLAEETGHCQVVRLAQRNGSLAMRTGDFLAEIPQEEFNMSAALGAGHF